MVDIWNVGCMIWDLFEGGTLFTGHDPEHQTYRSRAHLADMIALLESPPMGLLDSGKRSHKFFTDKGDFCQDIIPVPDSVSLEERETSLAGEDKERFIKKMRKMLQWDPFKRSTAGELANDEWIMGFCDDPEAYEPFKG